MSGQCGLAGILRFEAMGSCRPYAPIEQRQKVSSDARALERSQCAHVRRAGRDRGVRLGQLSHEFVNLPDLWPLHELENLRVVRERVQIQRLDGFQDLGIV